MSDLRTATIRLAYENPELRAQLLPLLAEGDHTSIQHRKAYIEPFTWLKNADKGGKDVAEFLKEKGDESVSNPNPDSRERYPEVKVKSLPKSEKGKGFFQKLFESWKGDEKGDSKGGEKGSGDVAKLQKRFKKPSDSDKMTFWKEVKRDSTRDELIDKDKVEELVKKEMGKAIEMFAKNPPKNAPKKPSMKDIALNYSRKRTAQLKKGLIRLAFHNPELRPHILPLLAGKTARREVVDWQELSTRNLEQAVINGLTGLQSLKIKMGSLNTKPTYVNFQDDRVTVGFSQPDMFASNAVSVTSKKLSVRGKVTTMEPGDREAMRGFQETCKRLDGMKISLRERDDAKVMAGIKRQTAQGQAAINKIASKNVLLGMVGEATRVQFGTSLVNRLKLEKVDTSRGRATFGMPLSSVDAYAVYDLGRSKGIYDGMSLSDYAEAMTDYWGMDAMTMDGSSRIGATILRQQLDMLRAMSPGAQLHHYLQNFNYGHSLDSAEVKANISGANTPLFAPGEAPNKAVIEKLREEEEERRRSLQNELAYRDTRGY